MEFFLYKLLLIISKPYSDEQNSTSSSTEYRPSPSLVPLPIHHFTSNSIKQHLPVEEYSCIVQRLNEEEAEEENCAVCFENLKANDKVRELQNCRHAFHRNCLDAWIDRGHATCPLCRAKLLADHGQEREQSRGDPWRSERMIYLFGEDCLLDPTG